MTNVLLDDLTSSPIPSHDGTATAPVDGGWSELMLLAADFPLEVLSRGSGVPPAAPSPSALAPGLLPRPRQVSGGPVIDDTVVDLIDDRTVDLVDGRGDGPLIGLGVGHLPLATR